MRKKYTIGNDGTIEVYNEYDFYTLLRQLWGDAYTEFEMEEGVDSFVLYDKEIGAWIDKAGFGWIMALPWLKGEIVVDSGVFA